MTFLQTKVLYIVGALARRLGVPFRMAGGYAFIQDADAYGARRHPHMQCWQE